MRQGIWYFIYKIGRRGAALLFFAFLDEVYAYSLAFPTREARQSETLAYIARVAPLWLWAALWAGVGVVCLVQAFKAHDRIAYSLAMGLKVLFGLTMLTGWWFAGLERGYVGAALWLVLAGWVYIISTWPEPPLEVDWPSRPPAGGVP